MLERFEEAATGYAWPLKGESWLLCGELTAEGAGVGVGGQKTIRCQGESALFWTWDGKAGVEGEKWLDGIFSF